MLVFFLQIHVLVSRAPNDEPSLLRPASCLPGNQFTEDFKYMNLFRSTNLWRLYLYLLSRLGHTFKTCFEIASCAWEFNIHYLSARYNIYWREFGVNLRYNPTGCTKTFIPELPPGFAVLYDDLTSDISSNVPADCIQNMKMKSTIGNSSYRLNFDLGKKNKIHHHS